MSSKYIQFLFMTIIISSCGKDDDVNIVQDRKVDFLGTKIVFTSLEKAKNLLETPDDYSRHLSSFDIKSKTRNINATSETDYLKYAAGQALEWTPDEISKFSDIISSGESMIKSLGLNLTLPEEIKLVKSTLKEEGGAEGYTRSNFIVLKSTPGIGLFLHELFHVYSRETPSVRDELYKTIHFNKGNKISLPDAIADRGISNPDAPDIEHYITVSINGESQDVVFITYAKREYTEGTFFDYLDKKLMLLEGGDDIKRPLLVDGRPVLKEFGDAENLRSLIGNNTSYDIHPEEVLAEHFMLLVSGQTVPDASFLDAMKKLLN